MTETVPRDATPQDGSVPDSLRARFSRLVRPRDGVRRTPLLLEIAVIVWLLWIYDAVNNLAPMRLIHADHDAGDLLHLERFLHIDPEAGLDHWLSGHPTLGMLTSNYYDNAHFVMTLGLVGLLWVKWPDLYRPLRNNLALINLIGMAVFWLFPTAPPRLFDPAVYPDVVANTHAFGSWHTGALATAANQLAAMPSLHIGWACWSALAMWRLLPGRRWAVAVWIYPVLTGVAVMATGNHWLLDVLAGGVTFAVATVLTDRWQGWWTSREARQALRRQAAVVATGPPHPLGPGDLG